jgi:hypothetical protein
VLRGLKDDQFIRERKMDQVINYGASDAMREIQECVKEITVINIK